MKHSILFPLLIGLLALCALNVLNGCGKKTEPEPEPKEENKLEPTLKMSFTKPSLNGIGFMDIVFTADGRAAALSTRKEIFFSKDDGANWQLIRKYSTLNNDTNIYSLALHPTEDIIFLGAGFFHNFNSYLRHLIIKKDGAGKWEHQIVSSQYIDQKSNRQYIPAGFTYKHSFWFKNYVINSFSNSAGNDGFVGILANPEKTDNPNAQTVMLPESKNPFVATCVIPVYDGFDKQFNCAGYEVIPPNIPAKKRIHLWLNFTWAGFNSSDNYGIPPCCLPDYMAASPDLSAQKFNKLMLYTGLRQLYHTQIRPGAIHQQEIILSKDEIGYGGELLCTGIDRQGHVWLGTSTNGMFRSTTPLP